MKTGRNPYIKKFYERCRKDGIVSKELIENRINEVRECKYRPDFDFKL
ncbi:MAG: hypothetical protein QXI11_03295 [Thermoproteota archaeon]